MFTFFLSARQVLASLAIILFASCSSGIGDDGTGYNHPPKGNVAIDRSSLEDDILPVAYSLKLFPRGIEMNIADDPDLRPESKDKIIAIWGTSDDQNPITSYEIVYRHP